MINLLSKFYILEQSRSIYYTELKAEQQPDRFIAQSPATVTTAVTPTDMSENAAITRDEKTAPGETSSIMTRDPSHISGDDVGNLKVRTQWIIVYFLYDH